MNRYLLLFLVQILMPSLVICEDQLEAVRRAELDRNYRYCLNGSSLCNRQLLTANQTEESRKSELDRNYRYCLNGSSLCNKALLGGNQGDQIKNSENKTPKNEQDTSVSQQREKLAEDQKRLEEEKRQQEQQFITELERQRQQLAEERLRLEEDKRQREYQRQSQRINLQVTHTQPAVDGSITITVQANADTASLLVNGEEQGGRTSGDYIIKKVARAGQETKFTVIATDINGNKDTKVITVTRQVVESAVKYAQLNPAQVKKQPERDAVAVIIGISKYESLPIAEFANDDARAFYDYAIRGLGVKPENIKLLVDDGAREAEILKTFRTWLPSRVKSSTEVFVFYSGHGLPTPDGSGLYLLPLHADREVIDDTAIPFAKINDAISMAKPKSVTVILDACYSGQTKAGQTLVASARPLTLKAQNSFFPQNFTVISASQSDQISSSSPDLQHGIFSYYLMKGMEGDADMNKDGKITLGEMRDYLVEQVGRQAAMMSRKQEPQLIGDAGRVLVGR